MSGFGFNSNCLKTYTLEIIYLSPLRRLYESPGVWRLEDSPRKKLAVQATSYLLPICYSMYNQPCIYFDGT